MIHALLAKALTPLIRLCLRVGVRLGPMVMLTVRGRTSGLPRRTPVDLWRDGDGSYLVATHDVGAHWVRNLRTAGEGQVSLGRRTAWFTAVELSPDEAVAVIDRVIRPRLAQPLAGLVLRHAFDSDSDRDRDGDRRRPVFALTLLDPAPGLGSSDTGSASSPASSGRRARWPVLVIALGLLVAAAHAVLGLAGRLDTGSWASGVALGLVVAGAGNHLRLFGPGARGSAGV